LLRDGQGLPAQGDAPRFQKRGHAEKSHHATEKDTKYNPGRIITMHGRVTEKGEREQEKDGADDLIPDDPRWPYHFGNNGSSEGLGVVGFYGANELDCVN
jgi:hypothetical protein